MSSQSLTDHTQTLHSSPKVLVEYKLKESDLKLTDHPYWKDIKWEKSDSIKKGTLVTYEKNFQSRNLLKVGLVVKARGKRASILFFKKSTLAHISKHKLYKFSDSKKLYYWKEVLNTKFKKISEKSKQRNHLRGN